MRKLEIRRGHGVSVTVCTDTRVWQSTLQIIQEICGVVPYPFTPAGGPKNIVDFQGNLMHHDTIGVHYEAGVRTFVQIAHLKICKAYQLAGYCLDDPDDERKLQIQELHKVKARFLDSFDGGVDVYLALAPLEIIAPGPNFLEWIG